MRYRFRAVEQINELHTTETPQRMFLHSRAISGGIESIQGNGRFYDTTPSGSRRWHDRQSHRSNERATQGLLKILLETTGIKQGIR
jgi:hypothetical protein